MAMRERFYVDTAVFRYRSGYREVNALLAVPSVPQPMPAILLAHDIFGLDDYVEELAIRFAREGYAVLVPDFYSTKGGPGPTNTFEDQQHLRLNTPDLLAVGDINNGYNYLKNEDYVDSRRVAVVGFGFGGTIALLAAAQNRELAAAVDFYGDIVYSKEIIGRTKPNSPLDMIPYINCPVLCIYGVSDDLISRQDVSLLERRLREKGKAFDLKVFSGAPNGFMNERRPEVYRPSVAREAMTLTLNWLDNILK
ncbi:MAG TPA: dienelactone hydrolase family protein [Chloroflexia bacterium]|nr:dienelactone hydrolase family protein [Chloroflexia bacterium]